jgi:RimJ/RimL family protein N-acetyltransferase
MANVVEPVELRSDDGRLLLRPPRRSEAVAALALLTDPDTRQWNPAPLVVDVVSARDWCDRGADWAAGGHATFSIVDATDPDGAFLGNVSVYELDLEAAAASVGYRFAPAHRGRGVATTALRTVTAWAFRDVRLFRMQLFHAVDNPASCAVACKAGYLLEGTLRSGSSYGDGLRHDEHLHARLASDRPGP